MALFDYQDNEINIGRGPISTTYNMIVKGIAHRGYSSEAPENTLPAYRLAKQRGFMYVETDIEFTSDGVPVLLHDSTIDRTSNGTGIITNLTWAQVQQADFGSWKDAKYAGTKIPSFAQFISLCRNIGLHPYIELKSDGCTEARVQGLVDVVRDRGMAGNVTWLSFSSTRLDYVKNYDASARLGLLVSRITSSDIATAEALKLSTNEVFIDSGSITDAEVSLCRAAGIPMEYWHTDDPAMILSANPYITGFTSNALIAGKVLYDANIE